MTSGSAERQRLQGSQAALTGSMWDFRLPTTGVRVLFAPAGFTTNLVINFVTENENRGTAMSISPYAVGLRPPFHMNERIWTYMDTDTNVGNERPIAS